MEKIAMLVNSVNPTSEGLDFACYLTELSHSPVMGFFLTGLSDASSSQEVMIGYKTDEGHVITSGIAARNLPEGEHTWMEFEGQDRLHYALSLFQNMQQEQQQIFYGPVTHHPPTC